MFLISGLKNINFNEVKCWVLYGTGHLITGMTMGPPMIVQEMRKNVEG